MQNISCHRIQLTCVANHFKHSTRGFGFACRIADDLLVGLAGDDVVHLPLPCGFLALEGLEESIAALGADAALFRIIRAEGNADRGAIVAMPHADTFEIFGVKDIVLVAFATAGLGLASGALFLGARPGVCLWVDDCEMRIAAL